MPVVVSDLVPVAVFVVEWVSGIESVPLALVCVLVDVFSRVAVFENETLCDNVGVAETLIVAGCLESVPDIPLAVVAVTTPVGVGERD